MSSLPAGLPLLSGSSTALQASVWSWANGMIIAPDNFLMPWHSLPIRSGVSQREHLLSKGRPKQQTGKKG